MSPPTDGPSAPSGALEQAEVDARFWALASSHGDPQTGGPVWGGPGDDDGAGGGGGGGGDGEWPARQLPRSVRVLCLVLAVALTAGTAGTWVAVVLENPASAYPAALVSVEETPGHGAGPTGAVVHFEVANATAQVAEARCTVALGDARGNLARLQVPVGPLQPGQRVTLARSLSLRRAPGSEAEAFVSCSAPPVPSHQLPG